MSARAVPIAIPTKAIEQRHRERLTNFTNRLDRLLQSSLTRTTAELAAELDRDAKQYLDGLEAERVELALPLLDAKRRLDAFFKRMGVSALEARAKCTGFGLRGGDGGLVGRFNVQERRRVEAERQLREQQVAEQTKRQHEAEIEHLKALGDEAGAALLREAKPLPTLVAAEPAAAVTGVATIEKRYGEVTEPVKLLAWLLDGRMEFVAELIEWREGSINRLLNRGIELPGVTVTVGVQNQNRGR